MLSRRTFAALLAGTAAAPKIAWSEQVKSKPVFYASVGPELTDRRLPAEYLARFLANPSIKPATDGKMQMPNLELRDKEIQPLIAFLTSERRAASK